MRKAFTVGLVAIAFAPLAFVFAGNPPTVTTKPATSIATTSAVLNGKVNPHTATSTAWFRIATSSPATCNDTFGARVPTSGGAVIPAGSTTLYAFPATGLTSSTTYYFCGIASSTDGIGFGSTTSFTTH